MKDDDDDDDDDAAGICATVYGVGRPYGFSMLSGTNPKGPSSHCCGPMFYKAFNFTIAPTSVQLMFLQVTWKFNVPSDEQCQQPLKFSCDTKANMLWDLQVEMISHDFTMFHLSAIHCKPSFLLLFCKARETCFAQAVTIDLTDSE